MSDYNSRIAEAIQTLQLASEMSLKYYHKPLIICYSGGKDSDVLLDLAKSADIPFDVLNSHTTVDTPETVYHIREVFSQFGDKEKITTENGQRADIYGGVATILYPKQTMWELIGNNTMPPTRIMRYCCSKLKETSTANRIAVTGVRKAESSKRAKWNAFEVRGVKEIGKSYKQIQDIYDETISVENELESIGENAYDCKFITNVKQNNDIIINAIINLTDSDIYRYIEDKQIKICDLYHKGYLRVGCIGCPMGGRKKQLKQFAQYPTYKRAYTRAFKKMIQNRKRKGLKVKWENENDCFKWWTEYYKTNIKGQMDFDEYAKERNIETIFY